MVGAREPIAKLAQALRDLQIQSGKPSVAQLKRRTGMPHATIQDKLSGKTTMKQHQLLALVRACGAYAAEQGNDLPADALAEAVWLERLQVMERELREGRSRDRLADQVAVSPPAISPAPVGEITDLNDKAEAELRLGFDAGSKLARDLPWVVLSDLAELDFDVRTWAKRCQTMWSITISNDPAGDGALPEWWSLAARYLGSHIDPVGYNQFSHKPTSLYVQGLGGGLKAAWRSVGADKTASMLSDLIARHAPVRHLQPNHLAADNRAAGVDLSARAELKFKFAAIDHEIYQVSSSESYRFTGPTAADRFVVFATSNKELADEIAVECEWDLFQLFWVPDASVFLDAADDLRARFKVGVTYMDERFSRHSVSARPSLSEVRFDHWGSYLPSFRDMVGRSPRRLRYDHLSDLRIFDVEFAGLVEGSDEMRSIEGVSVEMEARRRLSDGYCYWQCPFSSYVDRISLDVGDLDLGDRKWEFRVLPFVARPVFATDRWLRSDELNGIDVGAWVHKGQGFALIWRPKSS